MSALQSLQSLHHNHDRHYCHSHSRGSRRLLPKESSVFTYSLDFFPHPFSLYTYFGFRNYILGPLNITV